MYELQVGSRVVTVSADRLKPHTGAEPRPALPPRRGRPPGSGGMDSPGSGLKPGHVDEAENPLKRCVKIREISYL